MFRYSSKDKKTVINEDTKLEFMVGSEPYKEEVEPWIASGNAVTDYIPTQQEVNAECIYYLQETDWYVVRKQETGVEVPQDVLAKRQEARDNIIR